MILWVWMSWIVVCALQAITAPHSELQRQLSAPQANSALKALYVHLTALSVPTIKLKESKSLVNARCVMLVTTVPCLDSRTRMPLTLAIEVLCATEALSDLSLPIQPLVTFAQLVLTVRLTPVLTTVMRELSVSSKVLLRLTHVRTARKASTASVETLVL